MAQAGKRKQVKRHWLFLGERRLILFETGTKQALPYLKILDSQNVDDPLGTPTKHLSWLSQFGVKKLNILLANAHYQLLLSDVPEVPEDELADAIELKAADLISYDIDDALIDVIQLPSEAYRGRMKMAFIVAMQKTPVVHWLTELIQLGITVDLIDIELTQLRNLAVSHQSFNESGILHLKASNSHLLLNFNQEVVLSRNFDIGLSSLVTETTVQDGELELTVTEDNQSEIQIESLVLEIRRSFDYYESQLGLGSVAEIQFLCDEQYEQLANDLARRLGVRFVLVRPSDFMQLQLSDEHQDPVNYYNLIGSVYREVLA
jgi:MSHA biogenesis protein MshI